MAREDDDGDEFALIARHFAPLATSGAARGLLDDAAHLRGAGDLVVTTDAIVEGVHFLPDDPLDLVARKALRVNLSDLAAKGARAQFYLLTLLWPDTRRADEIGVLAEGLREDQQAFGVTLLGGDTARTPGPLSLSVTMFGAPLGPTPSRAGAQVGDDVWVSGAIGDGALGLIVRQGGAEDLQAAHQAFAIRRYQAPDPRVDLAALVGAQASASCDVSDGLMADAGKIAAASNVTIEIDAQAIPLSEAGRAWAGNDQARLVRLATGGDDYEILMTAPSARRALLASHGLTRIGRVIAAPTTEKGARLIGASGPIMLARAGFAHRLGGPAR